MKLLITVCKYLKCFNPFLSKIVAISDAVCSMHRTLFSPDFMPILAYCCYGVSLQGMQQHQRQFQGKSWEAKIYIHILLKYYTNKVSKSPKSNFHFFVTSPCGTLPEHYTKDSTFTMTNLKSTVSAFNINGWHWSPGGL